MSSWVASTSKHGGMQPTQALSSTSTVGPRSQVSFFLLFGWDLLYFSLWPFPLVLSVTTAEKNLVLPSLFPPPHPPTPPVRYLYPLRISALNLLFWRQSSSSFLGLSWYNRCSSPSIVFMVLCWTYFNMPLSFWYWRDLDWIQYFRCGFTSAVLNLKMSSFTFYLKFFILSHISVVRHKQHNFTIFHIQIINNSGV